MGAVLFVGLCVAVLLFNLVMLVAMIFDDR